MDRLISDKDDNIKTTLDISDTPQHRSLVPAPGKLSPRSAAASQSTRRRSRDRQEGLEAAED